MELSVVVGNPKPRSRTLAVAEAVAERVAAVNGVTVTRTIDLCDYAGSLFEWPHDELAALNAQVAASDLVVIASPTYKAAYTGLLKAFLDRYASNGLEGVTAVPVMTGSLPHHAMTIDTTLRPLLVELGASVPTRGLYFVMAQMDELDAVVDEWATREVPLIRQAVAG
jgi:FMN reductase